MSNYFYVENRNELAEMVSQLLSAITDGEGHVTGSTESTWRMFFSNSGAESNEGAIKIARKWGLAHHDGATGIVALRKSFHGRTLGTLAATGQEHYHELYQPLTPGFVHAEGNDLADVAAKLREHKCAGVLLECIQGEGGVRVMDKAFVQGVAKLCAEQDVLLMIDEVQTGNGRTGALYSYMNYDVTPDIVSTAKGLGGGLPLGAALLGEKVADVFTPGDHGSTFGGNPVCCAGAVSVLRRIDDALLAQVREKSDYIFKELTGAEGVESVSGMGLMVGIKPAKHTAAEVVQKCMTQGVLCLTAKDRVRLLPALNIPMELVQKAVAVIKAACAE